jgi:hypothetical protein
MDACSLTTVLMDDTELFKQFMDNEGSEAPMSREEKVALVEAFLGCLVRKDLSALPPGSGRPVGGRASVA